MALHWKHKFVSAKADGVDSTLVKPSNWNDEHNMSTDTTTGMLVGKSGGSTGVAGPLEELPGIWDPVQKMWNFFAGICTGGVAIGVGTSAQRPASPQAGQMRYNTDTGAVEIWGLGGQASWTPMGAGSLCPPGGLMAFAMGSIPYGWFWCNGQAISRTAWPGLFSVLGTGYGGGDGSTTFNVPNFMGLTLVNIDNNLYGLNTRRGNYVVGIYVNDNALPYHQHQIQDTGGTPRDFPMPQDVGLGGMGGGSSLWGGGPQIYNLTTGASSGGGQSINIGVEQPSVGVYICIKG